MTKDAMPAIPVLVDTPLQLEYDAATGLVHLTGPMIEQDGMQLGFRVSLTAEAQAALRDGLERLEREHETPPSSHRRTGPVQ